MFTQAGSFPRRMGQRKWWRCQRRQVPPRTTRWSAGSAPDRPTLRWDAAQHVVAGIGALPASRERGSHAPIESAGLSQISMRPKRTPLISAGVQGHQPGAHRRLRFRSHSLASRTVAEADRLAHGRRRATRSGHPHAIGASATGSCPTTVR